MLATTTPRKTAGGVWALIAALVLLSAAPAEAALQLKLYDGTDTLLIIDQDDGTFGDVADLSGTLGRVLYVDVFNDWDILATGTGYPFTGPVTEPRLRITLDVASLAAGDLTVSLSQDGFTGLSGLHATDIWNGQTDSTLGLDKAVYWGTTLFDMTNPMISETVATGVWDEAYVSGVPITDNGSIALTVLWTIRADGAGETTAGNNTLTIPEPAMLGLFGVGLLGFAALARRRLRRGQAKT